MVCHFWHQILTQLSMLFQILPFILLRMVAHLTITWLVETIPTANHRACVDGLKAAMERKKKGTIWKSNKNFVRIWCQKWHTILFTATNQDNKHWTIHLPYQCLVCCFQSYRNRRLKSSKTKQKCVSGKTCCWQSLSTRPAEITWSARHYPQECTLS